MPGIENKIWDKLAPLIQDSKSILLSTHINADGDGLGSEIAFYYYIKSLGKECKIINCSPLPKHYQFIDPENKMDNKHKGKIEEVIYHGDHTRVRLDLLGNKDFILKVPNSSARMDIKLGNEINVGWNSQDARALDPK